MVRGIHHGKVIHRPRLPAALRRLSKILRSRREPRPFFCTASGITKRESGRNPGNSPELWPATILNRIIMIYGITLVIGVLIPFMSVKGHNCDKCTGFTGKSMNIWEEMKNR